MVLGASKSMASNFKPRQEPRRANGQGRPLTAFAVHPRQVFSANHRQPRRLPAAFNASRRCAPPKPTNWHTCAPLPERLDRRDLIWIDVTRHPTAEWIARQITEALPWNEAPRYLIHDRDRIFGAIVTRRLRAMGIRDKPIAPASPWQNAFAERLIGSIRRECVDHIIVLGEAHLRRILRCYARYYNEIRTHRALNKDAPRSRAVQQVGIIKSHAILGGLHHQYVRIDPPSKWWTPLISSFGSRKVFDGYRASSIHG